MAVGIGTEQVTGGVPRPDAALPGMAPRRQRALRLPRSPKIIAGLAMLAFFVLLSVIGPLVAPYSPDQIFANSPVPLPPSAAHWLGTTNLQQDVFSQLLVGGGDMLLVAFIAGVIATALSVVMGVTAGYLGGLADDLLSMLANIFLVMPALPLLVILFGFLGKSGSNDLFLIGFIISVTGWAWGARVLRAQTLTLRNRDYIDSAKIIGERRSRIIFSEVLPNLTPIVASSFLFTVLYAVGTYTAMAFLGLVNPNWSWGGMLYYAQGANAELTGYWWWFIPPGLAVALLGTSLVLLNFGIDEFINPRLRAAGLSRRSARRQARALRSQQFALTPVVRTQQIHAEEGQA
ncbi:MAG TPA: ABC transporter permease [Streptosporangiaceae bacterium]|nr:ABC transporter permease [Streptosporangiaceae bacterium]